MTGKVRRCFTTMFTTRLRTAEEGVALAVNSDSIRCYKKLDYINIPIISLSTINFYLKPTKTKMIEKNVSILKFN